MTELVSAPDIGSLLANDNLLAITTAAGNTLYKVTPAELATLFGTGWKPLTFNSGVTITVAGKTFTQSDQSVTFAAGDTLVGQVLFSGFNNYQHGEIGLFYSPDGVTGVAMISQADSNNVLYFQSSSSWPSWTSYQGSSEGRTLNGPAMLTLAISDCASTSDCLVEGSVGTLNPHVVYGVGSAQPRGTGHFYIENTSSTAVFQGGRYKLETL